MKLPLKVLMMILKLFSSDLMISCIDLKMNNDNKLPSRQINTKYGSLRGNLIKFPLSSKLPPIESYLGVPYATPPIGSLRFMPPVTPTHWKGVRSADKYSTVCPQKLPNGIDNPQEANKRMSPSKFDYLKRLVPLLKNQSEDCLYLNIWTPITAQQDSHSSSTSKSSFKVPVIVFIHGESYDWNSGNAYDGSVLASFGQIVVVTINYRLGVFGFLPAVVDGSVRGNYGLMDQVAALHWIQENIGEFGGQFDNLTIIGHEHGAACAHLLMNSPMAKGLFKRVILMSGSALSPWAIARDADLYAKNLAQELRCPIHDSGAIVDCLRKKKFEEILSINLRIPDYLTGFGPIIDSIVVPSMPKSEFKLNINNNKANSAKKESLTQIPLSWQYDLLFGFNRIESPCIFSQSEELRGIDTSRRDKILRTLIRNLFDFHQQAIFLTLINEYTDWLRPIDDPMAMLESLKEILSDALIVAPLVQTGDFHSYVVEDFQSTVTNISPSTKTYPTSTKTTSTSTKTYSTSTTSFHSENRTKTFFYVFVHQNEEFLPIHQFQKLNCFHNDELSYLFGVPLSIDHFIRSESMSHLMPKNANFTKNEMILAETLMTYWVNFVKFGDPSVLSDDTSSSTMQSLISSSISFKANDKGRFDSIQWPSYDPIQRKYMIIGLKPKARDHYHSHRLSFWLNLIPRLHHPGDEQVYLRHHLLSDHDNLASYDGTVRQLSFKFLSPLPTVTTLSKYDTKNHQNTSSLSSLTSSNEETLLTTVYPTSNIKQLTTLNYNNSSISDERNSTSTSLSSGINIHENYSTAFSITIAIGSSLLILNLVIFVGVYYKLDRNNKLARLKNAENNPENKTQETQRHNNHFNDENLSYQEEVMLSESIKMNNPSRISTSPISQDGIYYQYKQKFYQHPNSYTNSLRRSACKIAAPKIPDGICVTQIGPKLNETQVPHANDSNVFTKDISYHHNCIAKEMAV